MTPSQFFAAVKALFEAKELSALLGPVANAAGAVAQNPSEVNIVLQLAQLEGAIIAAQPGILQSELQLIATDLAAAAASASAAVSANSAALAAQVAAKQAAPAPA